MAISDKKQYIFFIALGLIVLSVAGFRYYDYVIKGNFILYVNAVCNPEIESCFAENCDAGDTECDSTPYKKVEILAYEAPECLVEHICENFSCTAESCSITYCPEDALEEWEVCVQ